MAANVSIAILLPTFSKHEALHYFSEKIHEAFLRSRVRSCLIDTSHGNAERFLNEIFDFKPDYTLSFNGLLPDEKGQFLCDLIKIPHFAYVVDSPNYFTRLVRSPLTKVSCTDENFCSYLKQYRKENVFFLPHGVDSELEKKVELERIYDVALLATCEDYEEMERGWKKCYPEGVGEILHEAADAYFASDALSHYQCLVNAIQTSTRKGYVFPKEEVDLVVLIDQLEHYITGKHRTEMARAITSAPLHVFGDPLTKRGWPDLLKGQKNVVFHKGVSFKEADQVLRQSKVVLNSMPLQRRGSHERFLLAIGCGAKLISSPSTYLEKEFPEESGLCYFRDTKKLDETAQKFLLKPLTGIKKAKEELFLHHTWEARVAKLLSFL